MQHSRDSLCHALLEQAAVGVCVQGLDGRFLDCNDRFATLLGVAPGTIAGLDGDALGLVPDAAKAFQLAFSGALRTGETVCQDFSCPADSSDAQLQLRSFPLRDAGGAIFAVASLLDTREEWTDAASKLADLERENARLRQQFAEMELLASTDRLTGAWNRRRFEDTSIIEMSRAERYHHPVSLLMLDIDHFKEVNDVHGHAAGDLVLKVFVREIGCGIRKVDSIARWGGEEFIVLAPNTRLAEASRLAEKLRTRIATALFPALIPERHALTMSVGVAEYQRGEGLDGWMARADRALYAAKRDGRNRVVADPLTSHAERARPVQPMAILRLVWHESYQSGHPLIDAQHQKLFCLANRLLDAISANDSPDSILVIVAELLAETVGHFADEEGIHREIGFPEADRHADEHAQLVAKATRLGQYVRKGTMSAADLFQFLAYDVIAQHMLGTDRRFSAYINRIEVPTLQ